MQGTRAHKTTRNPALAAQPSVGDRKKRYCISIIAVQQSVPHFMFKQQESLPRLALEIWDRRSLLRPCQPESRHPADTL